MRTTHGEQTLEGGVGDVMFDPEQTLHSHLGSGEGDKLRFIVARLRVQEDLGTPPQAARVRDEDGRLRCLFEWMLELHPACNERNAQTLEYLARSAIAEFYRLQTRERQSPVSRSMAYMKKNLSHRLTLQELADHAGMSKFYFLKHFKQQTGSTPMEMLRRLRVEAAQPHIVASRLKLDAIAASVGLVDGSHLSRLFRQVTGETPGAFRRRSRNQTPQLQPQPAHSDARSNGA